MEPEQINLLDEFNRTALQRLACIERNFEQNQVYEYLLEYTNKNNNNNNNNYDIEIDDNIEFEMDDDNDKHLHY
jgi:hypothetical protein